MRTHITSSHVIAPAIALVAILALATESRAQDSAVEAT